MPSLSPDLERLIVACVDELAARIGERPEIRDAVAVLALGVAEVALGEPDPPEAFERLWRRLLSNRKTALRGPRRRCGGQGRREP